MCSKCRFLYRSETTVKLDFHLRILLVADEIFTHEKGSDVAFCHSEPFNCHPFGYMTNRYDNSTDVVQKLGVQFVSHLFAHDNFAGDKRNA